MVDISIKSKRTTLLIGSTICVLTIVALLFLIKKSFDSAIVLKGEILADQSDLTTLNKIYEDVYSRSDEIDKVLATIPGSYEEVSTYAKVLELTADDTGVSVEMIFSSAESKETLGVKSVGVAVKATGPYENLVKFMDAVSKLPYHIQVDTLTVSKTAGVVTLNSTFRLFTNIK